MKASELQGLMTAEACDALAELAAAVPPRQAIVEIGGYRGQSACALAAGGRAHVYSVDPWDLAGNPTGRFGFAEPATREAFARQVDEAGLSDRVTAIQGFSTEVALDWAGPLIGLLYIDGDHSEEAVRADYLAWRRYLAPNGRVAFDDLDTPRNPGVRLALEGLGLAFTLIGGRVAVVG